MVSHSLNSNGLNWFRDDRTKLLFSRLPFAVDLFFSPETGKQTCWPTNNPFFRSRSVLRRAQCDMKISAHFKRTPFGSRYTVSVWSPSTACQSYELRVNFDEEGEIEYPLVWMRSTETQSKWSHRALRFFRVVVSLVVLWAWLLTLPSLKDRVLPLFLSMNGYILSQQSNVEK